MQTQSRLCGIAAALMLSLVFAGETRAQEPLPWSRERGTQTPSPERPMVIRPGEEAERSYGQRPYAERPQGGVPYEPRDPGTYPEQRDRGTFSSGEIMEAGHRFFGTVTTGLAKVIEHAFARAGRPNGYILGEEAGGAFIAGLRYGEGMLYTKNAGEHKVYWQGPSIGYDFGAEGSKTMILVYNLRAVDEIYNMFGGIAGSAYFIGGVGVTFLTRDHITLAPIRSGVGLRLGANIGYLKYTRRPTWNPF